MSQIYWIYGIPGSGKTTIAKYIRNKFRKWDLKCILLDDEIMMVLDGKTKLKLVKWLSKKCDFLLITTVGSPIKHPLYMTMKTIQLECDLRVAQKRHAEVDDNVVDDEEVQYERFWMPWATKTLLDHSFNTTRKSVEKTYEEIYHKIIKHDLLRFDLEKK